MANYHLYYEHGYHWTPEGTKLRRNQMNEQNLNDRFRTWLLYAGSQVPFFYEEFVKTPEAYREEFSMFSNIAISSETMNVLIEEVPIYRFTNEGEKDLLVMDGSYIKMSNNDGDMTLIPVLRTTKQKGTQLLSCSGRICTTDEFSAEIQNSRQYGWDFKQEPMITEQQSAWKVKSELFVTLDAHYSKNDFFHVFRFGVYTTDYRPIDFGIIEKSFPITINQARSELLRLMNCQNEMIQPAAYESVIQKLIDNKKMYDYFVPILTQEYPC